MFLLPFLERIFVNDHKGLAQGGKDDSNPGLRNASLGPPNPSPIEENCLSKASSASGGLIKPILSKNRRPEKKGD
jgi:hypothetical protein